MGSKKIDLKMQPFNVVMLIKKIIDEKQIEVRESKKKLIVQINEVGDIPELVADPVRIEQVLSNILNNAIDYSQDNGEIKISISAGDQNVEIAVKDQGIGIPVEEQEFVFDRFYRGKNAVQMNTAGAGLGLSIAKTLVELQGGNIHLVSSGIPGEGVTVSISLPIISNEVISS
jgi:signal transduction histidine kinase